MRIFCINGAETGVSNLSYDHYITNHKHKFACDAVMMSFNTFGKVDLTLEMAEQTDYCRRIVALSADEDAFVLCGARTTLEGRNYLSVIAAANGKFLGTCDRTLNLHDGIEASDRIKVFNTKFGMWGALVDKDARSELLWSKTSPLCDVIVNITTDDNIDGVVALAKKFVKPTLIVTPQESYYLDFGSLS